MKNRKLKKWMLALGVTAVLVMPAENLVYAAKDTQSLSGEEKTEDDAAGEDVTEVVVNIGSAEEFMEAAKNCKYDNWSIGKKLNLTADIDLSGEGFEGIGYFNGTFEGNGHTISVGIFTPKGSNYGFFRYIGELGTVNNVTISGTVAATGSATYIGGVAGINYGVIKNSAFQGNISGQSAVGGIAGANKSGAVIIDCKAEGLILATNYTGGIAGKNEGLVSACTNSCSVNVEELETSIDLGGVDVGSLNFTQKVVSRNNMGGIAGSSNGIIADCKNLGTIGFQHTGYNVGGIAGSQKGVILNSVNEGILYGRKDVGGIVGQAVPYIESEYLEDKVDEIKGDIDRLSHTMQGISASVSQAAAEAKNYLNILNSQYSVVMNKISGNLDTLSNSVSQENAGAQQYVDNINNALNAINEIQSQGGTLSQEQIDAIQNNLNTINDNLVNLQGNYSETASSAAELVDSISAELNNTAQQKTLEDAIQKVDGNIQSAADGISNATSQLNHIADNIGDNLAQITQSKEEIQDISSADTAENIDGVISGCINRGSVHGDLNVGGIAGTMNIEYEDDPEFDMDLSSSVNITLRSMVNNVVIHSINYGTVQVKKNSAGGIAGLQELGLVYDCEGYGQITSESGSYLGGIVGKSVSAIQKSYSLCNIAGENNLGGICGSGYTVKESIGICSIESEGEYLGSIAGELSDEGEVKDNLYVNEGLNAVDDISYAGMAEPRTYEEIMAAEGIPEGFRQVTVSFETEDGSSLGEKKVAYGGTLSEKDFPQAPEEKGCYVKWTETEELKDIRRNITIYAEQIPWTESISGNGGQEDGKELFIVKGEFHKEAELVMEEVKTPDGLPAKGTVEYAYSWNIQGEDEKTYDTLEGHFYIPNSDKKAVLWIKQADKWKSVEAATDGSYLVAEIPYGAEFALVSEPASKAAYLWAGGVTAVALILVFWRKRTKGSNSKLKNSKKSKKIK